MGLSIITVLFTQFMYQPSVKRNNVVHFYKCQSETFSLDNEYESNLFMSEEDETPFPPTSLPICIWESPNLDTPNTDTT